jgi:hypothetical protein
MMEPGSQRPAMEELPIYAHLQGSSLQQSHTMTMSYVAVDRSCGRYSFRYGFEHTMGFFHVVIL